MMIAMNSNNGLNNILNSTGKKGWGSEEERVGLISFLPCPYEAIYLYNRSLLMLLTGQIICPSFEN